MTISTDPIPEEQQRCINCQVCCKMILIPAEESRSAMEFYRARKFLLRRDKRGLWIVFLHECPHLTASGCDIYETRPMLCRTAKPDGFTCKLCLEIAEAIGLKSQDNDEVKP